MKSSGRKFYGAKVISLGFNNDPKEIEKDLLGDIDHSLKVDGFSHTAIMYQNRFFDPQSTRGVETLGQLKKVMAYKNYPKESHIYCPILHLWMQETSRSPNNWQAIVWRKGFSKHPNPLVSKTLLTSFMAEAAAQVMSEITDF